MECLKEKWVRLASFLSESDTEQWWRAIGRLKFPDQDLLMISWEVFYDKYFSDHEKDRLDKEFRGLWQENMAVAEYEATFSRLEWFGQS